MLQQHGKNTRKLINFLFETSNFDRIVHSTVEICKILDISRATFFCIKREFVDKGWIDQSEFKLLPHPDLIEFLKIDNPQLVSLKSPPKKKPAHIIPVLSIVFYLILTFVFGHRSYNTIVLFVGVIHPFWGSLKGVSFLSQTVSNAVSFALHTIYISISLQKYYYLLTLKANNLSTIRSSSVEVGDFYKLALNDSDREQPSPPTPLPDIETIDQTFSGQRFLSAHRVVFSNPKIIRLADERGMDIPDIDYLRKQHAYWWIIEKEREVHQHIKKSIKTSFPQFLGYLKDEYKKEVAPNPASYNSKKEMSNQVEELYELASEYEYLAYEEPPWSEAVFKREMRKHMDNLTYDQLKTVLQKLLQGRAYYDCPGACADDEEFYRAIGELRGYSSIACDHMATRKLYDLDKVFWDKIREGSSDFEHSKNYHLTKNKPHEAWLS